MSDDLISREAIIKILEKDLETGDEAIPISWLIVWLKMQPSANAVDPTKSLKHYLEFETQRTTEWLKDKSSPMYDGVCVGNKEAKELQEKHIKFCQRLLEML